MLYGIDWVDGKLHKMYIYSHIFILTSSVLYLQLYYCKEMAFVVVSCSNNNGNLFEHITICFSTTFQIFQTVVLYENAILATMKTFKLLQNLGLKMKFCMKFIWWKWTLCKQLLHIKTCKWACNLCRNIYSYFA